MRRYTREASELAWPGAAKGLPSMWITETLKRRIGYLHILPLANSVVAWYVRKYLVRGYNCECG